MRTIYYIHGYQTSGAKFKTLQNFYNKLPQYRLVYWEWDETEDISLFIQEKIQLLSEDHQPKILMADSMGCNIAWTIVNHFSELHYVMSNPVFSPDQVLDQTLILPEVRNKFYTATSQNIINKNVSLIISKYDEVLSNNFHEKIFTATPLPLLELDDEHSIYKMQEFMPQIHLLIEQAFLKTEKQL